MKQIIRPIMFALLSFVAVASYAQEKTVSPKWVSNKGFWVIEGNKKQPKTKVIRFYNNDNILVYKETLTKVKLNPDKRKVKMKLKKVLEESVEAWQRSREPSEELAYVKTILN